MAKKILIIAGIVVLFLMLAVGVYFWMFEGIYKKPAFGIKDYYDANQQKITGEEQVMIDGETGVTYITFQVNVLNEDTTDLSVEITDATPQSLKDKLPIGIKKTVAKDQTGSWISGLVDMTPYVLTDQPFSVTVKATSPIRKDAVRTNDLTVTVEEDPEAIFSIELISGGNEDPGIIPDPGVTPGSDINFRTSDLSYAQGSAIAVASACGNNLVAYGYYAVTGSLGDTCAAGSKSWCGTAPVLVGVIPGGWLSGGEEATLWKVTESDRFCVCDSGSAGTHVFKRYSNVQSSSLGYITSSGISTSPTSVDELKESTC